MFLRTPALLYASGTLGAFVASFLLIFLSSSQLLNAVGITLAPSFTLAYLAPKLVWGGLWGFLFLVPIPFRFSIFGIFFMALLPAFFQLFVVYPQWEHAGWLGIRHGWAMPFLTYFYWLVWAFFTSLSMRFTGGR